MTELIEGTYVNAAGARNYKLYVGALLPGEAPPMFVMLHGCDQDATGFAAGTRMNELADECRGIVLYPEQCRMVNPMGCWNWYDRGHQSAARGEPSLIAGMTIQVITERGIDPARVYVAGLSAGGAMALILSQEYPDLYAAVGVHSGVPSGVATDWLSALRVMSDGPVHGELMRTNPRRRKQRIVPTIVFHGDADTTVHPSNGQAIHSLSRPRKRRLSATGLPTTDLATKTRTSAGPGAREVTRTNHSKDGVSDAELWVVHGGGHAWAGGSPGETYTDSGGPDASREMVRFFLQQRLYDPIKQRPCPPSPSAGPPHAR
jgi:poly(hydroxyalkanoate) depolymerase family esterase